MIKRMLKIPAASAPRPRQRGPKPVRVDPSRLIAAAQRVFARDGMDGISIRAIAKEAKCDPSLLYYHFENKDAIYGSLLERKFDQILPGLETIANEYSAQIAAEAAPTFGKRGHTPLQKALWLVMKLFRKHLKDDAGFRCLMRGLAPSGQCFAQSELMKYLSRMQQIICSMIDIGAKSGELRGDVDRKIAAFFFYRACIDLVDAYPLFGANYRPSPADAMAHGEKQWFRLFWAGAANRQQIATGEWQ